MSGYRLGVDIGGTFTDIVLLDKGGVLRNKKILSSPDDYSRAIEEGIRELLDATGVNATEIVELAHGTTVATNAIIERKGVTVGLITTDGFRDILEIARFRAPRLYDVNFRKPDPLVERRLRFTVPERITAAGKIDKPLDTTALEAVTLSKLDEVFDELVVGPDLKIGVWGKATTADRILAAGERVEIYRPLLVDPKEVRKARAAKAKAARTEGDQNASSA